MCKLLVKAFAAGIAFPATLMPVAYTIVYFLRSQAILELPFQFIPMYVPILFGLTNVLYVWIGDRCPIQNINGRLWISGATLGFIVSLFGVFVLQVPELLFGLSGGLEYAPLILLPLIYGAIFRYIIKWLNGILVG